MIVQCETCQKRYDDALRWTICPHRDLSESPNPEKENMNTDQVNKPTPSRHPAIESILQFFKYDHLPAHLQDASKPFCELAEKIADGPQNAEATVALRKLLEAKDAAVRAVLFV